MSSATQDIVIGIDLGTTNSAVAAVVDGQVRILPVHGQPTMPSAVGLDPAGRLVIGQAAKNQAISAPESTVLSIKRLMGTEQTVTLGDRTYRPEEISALILAELKKAAEEALGGPVHRAVITVPAFFNEHQRQATQDAGKLAGLDVLRIINEPTAAALAYGAGSEGQKNETLLVYDLGGGTFDVSVVMVENGVVEVRASHGDTHLGGDDFDQLLAQLAEERFYEVHREPDAKLTDTARRRLKAVMEKAKITLSDQPFAQVREEYLTENAHLVTEFSRDQYEDLIAPLLEKTLDCLQRALRDANITASQLDKVMLVGGATRTPAIHTLLAQRLGHEPRHEINPDLIVAMGAAIQGAALAGSKAPAILVDITAHTYSVSTLSQAFFLPEMVCSPIIRRGTPLPVRRSEVYYTCHDNQETVELDFFQGEGRYPEQNTKIGHLQVQGLSRLPRGNEIIVEFALDLNGLLSATAIEKCTGLRKTIRIDTAGQHRLNLDAARTNLAALFAQEDAQSPWGASPEEGEATEDSSTLEIEAEPLPEMEAAPSATNSRKLLASAKSLRQRAEAVLARGVGASDSQEIKTLLDSMATAIAESDWAKLEDLDQRLNDILFYLED